ncbi:ataxin-3, putative [Plasmodium gallinaceum]|uniref:ubiquitinyl hydrolase 1 n=1 Tax=Plasmodium gallinaceum TaxID=5849 RepID=A0A1J1GMI2_PLAGA|nr:ataxin-3, putative [Plasmodium gallinaceum]CRG93572.1 ataxin-3, putative [Plasmodium gallinaceum]
MSKKYVYWEKQGNDRMCGLHCINSILQGPYYSEDTLAEIGRELDDKEKEFFKCSNELVRNNSSNVLEDGFINISVLIECLKRKNILLKNVLEEDLIKIISSNHQDIGYICNLEQHWFSIRKIYNTWYVLDSLKSAPLFIKDMNLKFYFNDVIKKYHIFSVQNINPYISLPKPDINFEAKNPNQFYIPTSEISEISFISDGFISEDKFHMNRSEKNSSFSHLNKSQKFRWPENGGKKLNDEINVINSNNMEEDDDLKIALKLSMEEYFKNLPPPLEETSDENCINIMVKLSNKKIQKKFSVTKTLGDIFYWIEYESAKNQDICSSLLFRSNYYLFQIYPRRKFRKYQNGSIELQLGDKIEMVNDKTLKDLNFEKEETFMIS